MNTVLAILFIHWLADFIFQSHEMSLKKSKSVKWLSYHVLVYSVVTTLCWFVFSPEVVTIGYIFCWTFMSHWITDFFTSKWTSYLWKKESVHNFFVVIGIDQFIHATTLLLTYEYLIKPISI